MSIILRYVLFLCILSVAAGCNKKKRVILPDLRHNYSMKSKKPFGTYTVYSMLQNKYKNSNIEVLSKPFAEDIAYPVGSKQSLYVVISRRIFLSNADRESLLEYAYKGNQVFLSAEYIDKELLDTLGVEAQYFSMKSIFQQQQDTAGPMRHTSVKIIRQDSVKAEQYGFFYYPFDAHFIRPEEIDATVLGTNDENSPNYISFRYGNGRFFLHLNPESFSNYLLLSNQNKKYAEEAFSYFPAERKTVYWDDYYRIGRFPQENFSLFDVFLKHPMLKWALLLAFALMVLYLAFASKRRQRIVPLKPVNSNASISFVETIGRLYLQKKDNQNIAHKMTTYFLEYIRTKYYLNTSHLNAEFFSSLSRKSGVEEAEVKQFFDFIQQLQDSAEVTDLELLEYNNRMQQFIK